MRLLHGLTILYRFSKIWKCNSCQFSHRGQSHTIMSSSGDLFSKVAIITGASSGLGHATAILFAQKGASVVLCGRNNERLKEAVDQCIEASGGHSDRFTSVIGDLKDSTVRQSIVNKALQTFNRLDILVTNAGILLPNIGISDASEADFDEMFNVNVKSVFFLIQASLPHLEKFQGNIVNVSSILSTMVPCGREIYPMTKAAVDHMTRCLALDLSSKGIRVNAVNPSYVTTRVRRSFGDTDEVAKHLEQKEDAKQPLYGKCVTAEAVANSIAFLASDAAKFVTGQCHVVDGGRYFMGLK